METKVFEILDRLTFIPVLATKMISKNPQESYLLRQVGYTDFCICIQLTYLTLGISKFDPCEWDGRTMPIAHQYIIDNFEKLETGSVIDVQFIIGETDKPKQSERLTARIISDLDW